MTKPKFTPDPPPHLQGMPAEQAFPLFVDWVIRQEYRKEDWWPKNLEARVQALELLAPYCIGTWTIADAAYANFGYEVIQPDVACSPSTFTAAGSYDYSSLQLTGSYQSIFVRRDGLKLYGCDIEAGTLAPGIGEFTMSTAWDVTTMSFVAHKATPVQPYGIHFHPDGDRVFVVDVNVSPGSYAIREYALLTAWDISTFQATASAVYTTSSDFAARPYGITFSKDGLQMYTGEDAINPPQVVNLHWWTLSTAWDITTASYQGVNNLEDLSGWDVPNNRITTLSVDATGQNLITGNSGTLRRCSFSTPYDISTLSYEETYATADVFIPYGHGMDYDCGHCIISDSTNSAFDGFTIT